VDDSAASLIQQGGDKSQMMQGRGYGGHQYLIYVLKHKQLLQDSFVCSTQLSAYSSDVD